MTRARRAASAITAVMAAVALCGLATEAWALCPNCLGQNRNLTPTLEVLGAFLLVPFVVALIVLRVIRRAIR
jgi:hypothetical protein